MWIAHRANTLKNIISGLESSASGVELDVTYFNGTLVLSHDKYTCNEYTCTLQQAIELFRIYKRTSRCTNKFLMLDIKGVGNSKEIAVLLKKENMDGIFVASFNQLHLQEIKRTIPGAFIGFITSNVFIDLELDYDFISVSYDILESECVKKYKTHGKMVFAWTIENLKTIDSLQTLPDYYISDIRLA